MGCAVVTGGAGFIGSHLSERLLGAGYEVRVLDNFSTGRPQNLDAFRHHPKLVVHEVDIAERRALDGLFAGVEVCFHLAGLADIVPSIEAPLDYARANVQGTLGVLDAANQAGVRRVVYAASSSCYGLPEVYPTPESAPCRPQYPYALTKYLGEQAVLHWDKVYDLPALCLRLFNVYGPRSRTDGTYGAMFGVFLAQKLAGAPLTIVGEGTQTRDFTHVSDVVEAFILAARSPRRGEVFNVGTGRPASVARVAELLGGARVHIPKRPGEPDRTHAAVERIAQALGWRAKVDIEAGVRDLLDHIEDWREAPVWTRESIADATKAWFEHLGRQAV